jgi:hypothetical protein
MSNARGSILLFKATGSLVDRAISFATGGPYVHVELVLDPMRINDSYTVGFYDLLQMLHHCPSIEDARRLIVHYASVEEMSEHG